MRDRVYIHTAVHDSTRVLLNLVRAFSDKFMLYSSTVFRTKIFADSWLQIFCPALAAVPRYRFLFKTAEFAEWQYRGLACSKSMAAGGPYFRQVAASAIGRWQRAFGGGRRPPCPPGRGPRGPFLRELYFERSYSVAFT